jgi:pyrrolidone-carboxylate peptidase
MDGDDGTGVVRHHKQIPRACGRRGGTFADAVTTVFPIALLDEGNAPGALSAQVTRVALEQRDFGEPVDDLVVDPEPSTATNSDFAYRSNAALSSVPPKRTPAPGRLSATDRLS